MSFIHDALKKAQQVKDGGYAGYETLISSPHAGPEKKAGKAKWAFASTLAALALGGLVFCYYQFGTGTPAAPKRQITGQPSVQNVPQPAPPAPGQSAPAPGGGAPPAATAANPAADVGKLYAEALSLQLANENGKAEALYRQLIASSPNHADALNNLGVILMAGGKKEEALSLFTRVIALKQDFADAHYNLACIYTQLKDPKLALAHLERAVEINPGLRQWAAGDKDLQGLRSSPTFKKIISKG